MRDRLGGCVERRSQALQDLVGGAGLQRFSRYGVRLPEPLRVVGVHPLPTGWANVFTDEHGARTVEPCPTPLVQSCERKRRLVYTTASDDGELTAGCDRADYVVTTADWALAATGVARDEREVEVAQTVVCGPTDCRLRAPPTEIARSSTSSTSSTMLFGVAGRRLKDAHWIDEVSESMLAAVTASPPPRCRSRRASRSTAASGSLNGPSAMVSAPCTRASAPSYSAR